MRQGTLAVAVAVAAMCALPGVQAFLPPPPRTAVCALSRGRALAVSDATEDVSAAEPSPADSAELSRKEKSREQVRALLKGLGELDEEGEGGGVTSSKKKKRQEMSDARKAMKEKTKLEPEVVFFEGPPHWTEVVVPTISILTVIGIFPFAASVARQIWVRYKVTSRRVSVVSGVGGKDMTEVIYPDIQGMNYVFRAFGTTGDLVIFLRDGSKLEMRSLGNFRDVYNYIREKIEPDAQERAPVLPAL